MINTNKKTINIAKKLKRCSCGGLPNLHEWGIMQGYKNCIIVCSRCGKETNVHENLKDAAKEWNDIVSKKEKERIRVAVMLTYEPGTNIDKSCLKVWQISSQDYAIPNGPYYGKEADKIIDELVLKMKKAGE